MKPRLFFDIPERKQPATQQLRNGENWAIMAPFGAITSKGLKILVPPSGYGAVSAILSHPLWKTDYGSIPRPFRNLLDKMKFGAAFILHDWLYKSKIVPRGEADAILAEILKLQGAKAWERRVIYLGVRLGGWRAWRANGNGKALRDYAEQYFTNYPFSLN